MEPAGVGDVAMNISGGMSHCEEGLDPSDEGLSTPIMLMMAKSRSQPMVS